MRGEELGVNVIKLFYSESSKLTHKYSTMLERVAKDKHSSLFGLFISDKEKMLKTLTTVVKVINLFSYRECS